MALLLAIALAAVPLAIAPGWLFYFDITPKAAIVAAVAAIGLLTWRRVSVDRSFGLLIAAQAASLALAAALSANPALSAAGGNWRRFGLVSHGAVLVVALMAAGYTSGDPGRIRFLLRVIAAAGIPVSLYAILQYFGWDPFLPSASYHVGEGMWTIVRPPGTLGRANYLATYLLYVVFAGLALAGLEASGHWRRAGAAACALGVGAIVLSGTRGAILGLAIGACVFYVWQRPRFSRRGLAAGLAALAASAAFYFSPAGLPLRARTRWYEEDPRGGPRLGLWRDSLRMSLQRPWAGFGLETFASNYPRFESEETARTYPDMYQESPHNVYLDALTGQGVSGLAVMLGLTVWGFWRNWHLRGSLGRLAAALGASLAAGLCSLQFLVFTVPTALYFYVTLAMLSEASAAWEAGGRKILLWAGPPAALLLAAYAVQQVSADVILARVRRELNAGRPGEAMRLYSQERRWQLPGTGSDLWFSRALPAAAGASNDLRLRLEVQNQAFEAAIRAVSTAEDKQNAWYNLAMMFAARNDVAQTERSLREAIVQAPYWFKPHWVLAQLLFRTGRGEEAEREASAAARLNGGKNPEVEESLRQVRSITRKN